MSGNEVAFDESATVRAVDETNAQSAGINFGLMESGGDTVVWCFSFDDSYGISIVVGEDIIGTTVADAYFETHMGVGPAAAYQGRGDVAELSIFFVNGCFHRGMGC